MKRFEVNVSKLEKIVHNGESISLISKPLGIKIIEKKFGKYKTVDNKEIIKAVSEENIESVRVGDLYFNSREINPRKR